MASIKRRAPVFPGHARNRSRTLSVQVSPDLAHALVAYCKSHGTAVSDAVSHALEQLLHGEGRAEAAE